MYRELKNYWSIEVIPHNGMHILRKEFDKVLLKTVVNDIASLSYVINYNGKLLKGVLDKK